MEIRSFIALELPEDVKRELKAFQDRIRRGLEEPVKWVDPWGIHLTLKFLGNIPAAKIPSIISALKEASRGLLPLKFSLGELGAFPDLRKPQVIWVGVEGEIQKLSLLQRNIESRLLSLGFPREEREFVPHLTLGRVRRGAGREVGGALQRALSDLLPPSISFVIEAVSLMKSTLTPQGAIYSRLGSVNARGEIWMSGRG